MSWAGPSMSGRPAMPVLVVRTLRSDHTLYGGRTYRVGRDPASNIVMTDSRVSWRHAVLQVEGGTWVVEDLGSANGTFLGLQRLDRIEINADCVVRLGNRDDGPVLRCMPETASPAGSGTLAGFAEAAPLQAGTIPAAPATSTEEIYAEILAEVMKVEQVPVDGHFFDDLGADSLVMAKFCARVRKREDLPSLSMKDIYAHPTIRSLAEESFGITEAEAKGGLDAIPTLIQPRVPIMVQSAGPRSAPGLTRRAWSKLRGTVTAGSRRTRPGKAAAETTHYPEPAIERAVRHELVPAEDRLPPSHILPDDPAPRCPEGSAVDATRPGNRVECSVFAPPVVSPGSAFLIQVFAHISGRAHEAMRRAREFDADSARRAIKTLESSVSRGTRLAFCLTMPGLRVDDPMQSMVWWGTTESVQFGVSVPKRRRASGVMGTITISQDSIPIGHIKFILTVAASPPAGQAPSRSVELGRWRGRQALRDGVRLLCLRRPAKGAGKGAAPADARNSDLPGRARSCTWRTMGAKSVPAHRRVRHCLAVLVECG